MKKTTAKKKPKSKTIKCSNGRLRSKNKLQSGADGILFEVNVKSMRNNFSSKVRRVSLTQPISAFRCNSLPMTKMNRVGDRALIKSPSNSLYLFHIAQNRYTCLMSSSDEVDYFNFLDKSDSSILLVFRNKHIRILTQSGSVLQKIIVEKKKIRRVEVAQAEGIFLTCYDRHLQVYRRDPERGKAWNLWKKMFTVSRESIKSAKLIELAR